MIPAILIILIVHIIIAIRWMLIKILSAVINDWEQIKVIVPGGCYLDIIIIRKNIKKSRLHTDYLSIMRRSFPSLTDTTAVCPGKTSLLTPY